MQDSLY
jgi:hypothetical protein